MNIHRVDKNIGLTMGNATVKEIHNAHGQHYWKAVEPIGSLFGQEVTGQIEAYGKTRELCLENLAKERKQLADSIWE